MHIPFRWAKQRPQFLAENLNNYFDVLVESYQSFRIKNQRFEPTVLSVKKIIGMPFAKKSKITRKLNTDLIGLQLLRRLKKTDIVWITHPKIWPSVKGKLSDSNLLIYDCMDNAIEFPDEKNNSALRDEIMVCESELLARADVVFFSSLVLRETLKMRYRISNKPFYIINNGISKRLIDNFLQIDQSTHIRTNTTGKRNIVYIGTISNWFDFQLLEMSTEKYPSVVFHLYGPKEIDIRPNPNLIFHGPIPHTEVLKVMLEADALIMPFLVTPLIESVNPVKLYEYILACKPVIATRFKESEYFEDFVYLFSGSEEFQILIKQLADNQLHPKNTREKSLSFCLQNTWEEKALHISTLLHEIL